MSTVAILFGRKGSKGIKNKNIYKLNNKPLFKHPIDEVKKVSQVKKIYVSTDDKDIIKGAKKIGCQILHRPKNLTSDKALLSDAMQDAVHKVLKIEKNIKFIVLLLCNSPCFTSKELEKGFSIIKADKKIQTVTTISKLNMFSPVRAKKIQDGKLINYIDNKTLSRYTALSGDRNKSVDSFFCTNAFSICTKESLIKMSKNPWPFKWMGKKIKYIIQEHSVGDIDFEWQLPSVEWWLKKYKK